MLCVQEAAMKTTRILLALILGLAVAIPAFSAPPPRGGGSGYRGGAYAGGGYRGGYNHGKNHYHGTRWVVGVNVGFPGYWGGYWGGGYWGGAYWGGWPYWPAAYPYPYPYPYYPAPVVVQQQPTTYIEQPAPPAQQQQGPVGYWYYCTDPGAYYPYVKECPAGWQRVAPQPSN